jgi:hypothetical protein
MRRDSSSVSAACEVTTRTRLRLLLTMAPHNVRPSQKRAYAVLVRKARIRAMTAPATS